MDRRCLNTVRLSAIDDAQALEKVDLSAPSLRNNGKVTTNRSCDLTVAEDQSDHWPEVWTSSASRLRTIVA